MPQLPSGRYIAVDAQPLQLLLERWSHEGAHERLSALRSVTDLVPYVRILNLVPRDSAAPASVTAASGSLPLPEHLEPVDSGLRLSAWPGAFATWPAADKAAFQHFIDERSMPFLQTLLADTKARFADCNEQLLSELEQAWAKAGVHPNPRAGPGDLPGSADIHEYHVAIALARYCEPQEHDESKGPDWQRMVNRLKGLWVQASRRLPLVGELLQPSAQDASVDALPEKDPDEAPEPPPRPATPTLF